MTERETQSLQSISCSKSTLVQRLCRYLTIANTGDVLTIDKEVVIWNILARPHRCSSVVTKVEDASLHAEPDIRDSVSYGYHTKDRKLVFIYHLK